ncbi:MAG TPA: ABC transporter permease subunit [Acidimicrobiia bacterium]|nr:ABC transporter permease subunit [Acidimicrobiia bacterium]
MDFLSDVISWFAETGRWTGDDGIIPRTIEHLWLASLPMLIAVVVALPVAVWLGHRRIGGFLANAVVNIGRAVPSFGLIILAAVFFARAGVSLRFWPGAVALLALAIPPIFTNAYAAIVTVPGETVEAARGMGFTENETLWRIEVPMGAPLILAGIRISFIQVLATVPLAAVLSSGGGLGQYVVRGFAQGASGLVEVFAGAVLIAALTLGADWLLSRGERLVLPEGLRRRGSDEIRAAASIS